MAKDIIIEDEGNSFDPTTGAQKMPVGINRFGITPRTDYVDAPVDCIISFTLKGDRDFSFIEGERFSEVLDTVINDGVIEAITLRYYADGKWEVLAGETRWRAAKKAGLKTIPAHIIKCDDAKARRIWAVTNAARRESTVMDKIYGWWTYWENTKKSPGRKAENVLKDDMTAAGIPVSGKEISIRQIVKYHKIYGTLEKELLDSIAEKAIHIEAAYNLTYLTPEERQYLIHIKAKPSNSQSQALKELSQENKWNTGDVDKILGRKQKKRTPHSVSATAIKHFKASVATKLSSTCYNKMPEIIDEALDLYLEKHPEHRFTSNPTE